MTPVFAAIIAVFHVLGIITAIRAVMTARTPQGSAAWASLLLFCPYLGLPLYWVFGQGRFVGYKTARRRHDLKVEYLRKQSVPPQRSTPAFEPTAIGVFEALAQMHFRDGNVVKLLVDGEVTYQELFAAIDSAKEYLLVQFYIVRENDEIADVFKAKILAAARRKVRVFFLYDAIGNNLSRGYLREMRDAGVDIRAFENIKAFKNRFQVNFRNHRKTLIVDGRLAFTGGVNIGAEYIGRDKRLGYWRDTHLEIKGPAVGQIQVAFMEDWFWSSDTIPIVNWRFDAAASPGKSVLVLPSSPGDPLETYALAVLQAINSAQKRVWIATPYFVPDLQTISALQLAAARGVEVRILVPAKNDNWLCHLAHYSFLKDTLRWGIGISYYEKGFLHQKVILVDDSLSSVGTANFDNRSFRLNFELTVLVADKPFAKQVEKMLEEDFRHSRRVQLKELKDHSFFFRLAVRVARLFAPVL